MSNPLSGQTQGDVIAQCILNPFTDTVVSQWGFTAALNVVVAKTTYILSLIDTSAVSQANQHPVITFKRATANPARTVEIIVDPADPAVALRFQVIDFAGAAAAAANGDIIEITVHRSGIPQS